MNINLNTIVHFTEFSRENDTVIVKAGASVVLFCNITPTRWPEWHWLGVNESNYDVFSIGYMINPTLPNKRNLEIIANISEGKYNLQIKNASLNEEGHYMCSFVNQRKEITHYIVELKIKVPPKNITINDANTGILHGTENQPLVLNCSVYSRNTKEAIMWFNDSLLLGIGGPGTFELTIIPLKYDNGRIYRCIVNSSVLRSTLRKNVQLDIKYKPFITFNKGKHLLRVNETHSLTVLYIVDSNPVATRIVLEKNFKLYQVSTRNTTLTLNLFNLSRNDSGTYVCRAENGIGEGYISTEIIVQYPPSIEIKTDLDKKVLQCLPNGEPQHYTFYPWLHKSEFGEIIRYLKNTETINLQVNEATLHLYQYNGIYVCRVENGVSYINGTVIQSGQVFVRQNDKPVFVSQNKQRQYGTIGMEIDIRVFVYSCPKFHILKVQTRGYLSVEYDYIDIQNANVIDGIYSKDFRMNGFLIALHGFIIEANDFTSYKFWIENSFGDANFTVDLIDTEKQFSRSLNIYWQISRSFIGGLLLGIACTIFRGFYRKKSRKNARRQVNQEVHYDEVELADNNPSHPTLRNSHPVDTDYVIVQEPESRNSGNENPSETNSSEDMSNRSLYVASELQDYENSYQPLDLDNYEKNMYDETQVCSINILSAENTYVNTVL
ncbi:unnamed protein product [Mytilus coruscus]|uniref:Ig-like domain-containing protein n=1 Tax=Mytilus coruscus TaxID=42192 RepID=A0A6J8ARQ4_MYTCO|nr:unnamed protein product [Mytilus coruscus]